MDGLETKYDSIERQPMGRLISAAQRAGCRTVPVGRDDVHAELVHDGMLVGWLRKVEGINRLELSRREAPEGMFERIRADVAACEVDARRAMMAGVAMAR